MHTLTQSYRGLGLLIRLNWDRALTVFLILGALAAAGWIATLVIPESSATASCAICPQAAL